MAGGELKAYVEMTSKARELATQRMMEDAERQGADAVVMMRYEIVHRRRRSRRDPRIRDRGKVHLNCASVENILIKPLTSFVKEGSEMAKEDQYRNPQGDEGRKVIEEMNEHHRELTSWGLGQISAIEGLRPKKILDIGCGGGNCLRMLTTRYPNAHADGIDISEEAVKVTLDRNAVYHSWGKIDAQVASVSDLPFPEKSFDLVTAIETYFFWPDLEKDLAHAASRLKEGGVMLIVSEQYPNGKNDEALKEACLKYGMNILPNEEVASLMEKAGLKTQTFTNEDKNWVAFVGVRQ